MSRPNTDLIKPALPVVPTPRGSRKVPGPKVNVLQQQTTSGRPRVQRPCTTPAIGLPRPSTSSDVEGPSSKRSRHSLNQVHKSITTGDQEIENFSDSACDSDDADDDDERGPSNLRSVARKLRDINVFCEERQPDAVDELIEGLAVEVDQTGVLNLHNIEFIDIHKLSLAATPSHNKVVAGDKFNVNGVVAGSEGLTTYSWSEDFSTFSGQEEVYLRSPGPQVEHADDPVKLFLHVWDPLIVEEIVKQTNLCAWQIIGNFSHKSRMPKAFEMWEETTVEEIYRLFAIFIFMSMCYRVRYGEYWTTNTLQMPEFKKIMSRNRYGLLMRFLSFVNNYEIGGSSYERNIAKIAPIVNHCNSKFCSMYTPRRELSLDESLVMWKGRLSWAQCIRTKAARFGIKSFELCEAESGYLLRSLLHAGKDSSMCDVAIHSFEKPTAKVVLELMDGYLDVGHLLVMDNWYNQLPLSRYLKRRRTDVVGTMNRYRLHVPAAIKTTNESLMARGEQVARHCGDLTVVAWKDVKLVTAVSTYHNAEQVVARRAGESIRKPKLLATYNEFMGGVDRKDQMLSLYLMERKRGLQWYMKVFKRFLNESLLNTYIIYTKNPQFKVTHRNFRYKVAEGLLQRFKRDQVDRPISNASSNLVRLDGQSDHFPIYSTEVVTGDTHRHMRRRCTRCSMNGKRTQITTMCSKCKVPLCLAKCWIEYHTLKTL